MRCVWVDAWEGSVRMRNDSGIQCVQPPLAQGLRGRSAWLREVREKRDLGFFAKAGQHGGN